MASESDVCWSCSLYVLKVRCFSLESVANVKLYIYTEVDLISF